MLLSCINSATHACQKLSEARENRQAITAKFADFQKKLYEKLLKKRVNIKIFRSFVIDLFPPGKCIPPLPTSLMEIFEAITYHGLWDCFHYSPLERIIQRFVGNDTEIKECVQSYEKDLKAYQLVTAAEDYIDTGLGIADPCPALNAPPAMRAKYDLDYYTPVEWKTKFIDSSLQYLAEVWKVFSSHYLMPESPPTALLDRVHTDCFAVTWLVPSHLIPTCIEKVKIDTDFFRQHRILKVTVEGQCVYEKVTKENRSVSSLYTTLEGDF